MSVSPDETKDENRIFFIICNKIYAKFINEYKNILITNLEHLWQIKILISVASLATCLLANI